MPDYPDLAHKVGVVGVAPKTKETSKGDIVVFSLAVPRAYGNDPDATQWVNVAVFNEDLQPRVLEEVYKGAKVAVEGSLKTRTQDGRTYVDMTAIRVGLVAWIAKNGTSKAAGKAKADDDGMDF